MYDICNLCLIKENYLHEIKKIAVLDCIYKLPFIDNNIFLIYKI